MNSVKNKYILFGPGLMAQKHYAEFTKRNISLVGVYSPNVIQSHIFKDIQHYNNINDLDAVDFDFGVITSPNYFHYEQIIYLVNRNKPIFVEKPLVVNLSQINELKKIGTNLSNVFVSFNLRYLEQTQRLLNTNLEPYSTIDIKWCRSITSSNKWSKNKSISGGGILIDWGVHAFDLLSYLLNDELSLTSIEFTNIVNGIDYAFKLILSSSSSKISVNMSWMEDIKKEPLTMKLSNNNSSIIWKKSNNSLEYINANSKAKANINTISMYDYFIEKYVHNTNETITERSNNINSYISTALLIDKCYKHL